MVRSDKQQVEQAYTPNTNEEYSGKGVYVDDLGTTVFEVELSVEGDEFIGTMYDDSVPGAGEIPVEEGNAARIDREGKQTISAENLDLPERELNQPMMLSFVKRQEEATDHPAYDSDVNYLLTRQPIPSSQDHTGCLLEIIEERGGVPTAAAQEALDEFGEILDQTEVSHPGDQVGIEGVYLGEYQLPGQWIPVPRHGQMEQAVPKGNTFLALEPGELEEEPERNRISLS